MRPGRGESNRPRRGREPAGAGYWKALSCRRPIDPAERLWRAHSDAVNLAAISRWLPARPAGRLLKTDLFDEALGKGLLPPLAGRAKDVVGIDIAAGIVSAALSQHPGLAAACADVRSLPFAAGAFDMVISNSTLDHFGSLVEVGAALGELHRVLRPGGRLLLTIDNLANPAIALRNALPFGLLNHLGLVPYQVGATCGPRRLRELLREAGFALRDLGAVEHCPRVAAVAVALALGRHAGAATQRRFLGLLLACERLQHWPTRFLTGHYLAALAIRQ